MRKLKVLKLHLLPSSLISYDEGYHSGFKSYRFELSRTESIHFLTSINAEPIDKKDRESGSRRRMEPIKHSPINIAMEYSKAESTIRRNAHRILCMLDNCPNLSALNIRSFDFSDSFGISSSSSSSSSFPAMDGRTRRFPLLSALDASNCHLLSDDVLASLTSCCSNLRYINLSRNLQITDASIAAIVSQCPNIIDINIFGCKALTDKSIHAISSHCSALRTVNLRKCENITDNSIVSLAENCQHLQNITLNDCKNISNVVRKVAEYRRNLLSMSIFNFFNKLSDDSVMKVAYCCPMLEAFKIGNCIDNSNISDASVMKLAANCPLLRVLHIERSGITDEALLKIATCCTQLRSLNVSDCALTTVAAVQQLLEMCPSIEHIACEFFEYKTSDRSLRVCGSRMTDGELHRIIRCIPEILHVNLSSGENFQDISVVRIADKFGGQLQSLSVAACEQLTDSCVSYLLDKCPNLVKLDLGYNRFSGVPFVDISEKQVRLSLKQIDISSCCMSTEVVIQILRVCPRLSVLFLNDKSIPFEQIRRIYCSRQLSPQQQQQLLDMQTQSPSPSSSSNESKDGHHSQTQTQSQSQSQSQSQGQEQGPKNIFANLYSPVFEFDPASPPKPLEVFNNSFFQFKRDGFVLKVIKYQVSGQDMRQILDLFPRLLSIEIQSPQTDQLPTDIFSFIADKYGDELQALAVSKFGRVRFTEDMAAALSSRCRALKELRVNSYDFI